MMINLSPLEEQELVNNTKVFSEAISEALANFCGIRFVEELSSPSLPVELTLDNITVFAGFTGTVQGCYALNVDLLTANCILGNSPSVTNFDEIAIGLLEEVVNIAAGAAIEQLKLRFGFLTFNSPIISYGFIRFPRYRNCSIQMNSSIGRITTNFAINMANLEVTDKLITTMNTLHQQQDLSYRDTLTGVYNRAYYEFYIAKLFGNKQSLTLIVCDVDNFKSINDTYGHSVGDLALKHIANAISSCTRDTDTLIRFGGDEFLVLLEEFPVSQAVVLIERIIEMLNLSPVCTENGLEFFVSISAGVSEYLSGETFVELFRRTDSKLYKAKEAGKNCICS